MERREAPGAIDGRPLADRYRGPAARHWRRRAPSLRGGRRLTALHRPARLGKMPWPPTWPAKAAFAAPAPKSRARSPARPSARCPPAARH